MLVLQSTFKINPLTNSFYLNLRMNYKAPFNVVMVLGHLRYV